MTESFGNDLEAGWKETAFAVPRKKHGCFCCNNFARRVRSTKTYVWWILAVVIVGVVAMGIAIGVAVPIISRTQVAARSQTDVAAVYARHTLFRNSLKVLKSHLGLLQKAVMLVNGNVSRVEFEELSASFMKNWFQGAIVVSTVAVLDLVNQTQLSSFRDRVNRAYEGTNITCRLTEQAKNASGFVPLNVNRTSQFLMIRYVEPLFNNSPAICFDLISNKEREEAFQFALATRKMASTVPVRLIQGGTGVILMQPWFSRYDRSVTLGVVDVVLSVTGMFYFLFQPCVALALYDITPETRVTLIGAVGDDAALVPDNPDAFAATFYSGTCFEEVVFGQNHVWKFCFAPARYVMTFSGLEKPILIPLLVGLVVVAIGVLVVVYVFNQKELERQKDIVLANASHEMRTPLFSIMLCSEMLKESKNLVPEDRAMVARLFRTAKCMFFMVNDMLDMARLQTHHELNMKIEQTCVDRVWETAVEVVEPISAQQGIDIQKGAGFGQKFCVLSDSMRLIQVFVNILTNAIKFCDKNGIICIKLEQLDGFLRISISDNGRGLTAKELKRIMKKFSGSSSSGATSLRGTGLGLHLCKQIISQMRGSLSVSSQGLYKGTTVDIILPSCTPSDVISEETWSMTTTSEEAWPPTPTASEAPTERVRVQEVPVEVPAHEPPSLNVLVVDDNKVNLLLIQRMLTRLNCDVTTAESGEEALEICMHRKFDLIFMDFFMPGMDGLKTAAKLRSDGLDTSTLIVILTASTSPSVEKECERAGLEMVVKPVSKDSLAKIVAKRVVDKV